MVTVTDAGLREPPDAVQRGLSEYGGRVQAVLRGHLTPTAARPYLDELIADYPLRGGKMMRSSLCIATARAFGARTEDALPSAVAIELLHNAMLIHDDIEDGSEARRGSPALHRLHGVPLALNAGDTLSLLSLRPLRENAARVGLRLALRIMEETERMAWESAEGQALELGWRRDNRLDLADDDYLTMVLKKTCWLATIHPCRVGALIGTRGRADLDAFFRFGFFLGTAFQIQDDVLNLAGDERYGKELNGDLLEGKRTLILAHAWRSAPAAGRRRMKALLSLPRESRDAKEVAWLRNLMDRAGSIDYARGVARGLAGAALREFEILFRDIPDSPDREFIRGLVLWVLQRGH